MSPDLKFYWKIMQRRLPAMATLFLIVAALALALAVRLPTVYQTSAELLVESAQIEALNGQSNDSAGQQLEIIQQRLMTRANLIDIANRFKVFGAQARLSPDMTVQQMRQNTVIRRLGGKDRATLMTLSFEGASPQIVASVVNQYVTLVLEENARFNTGRAKSTLAFFQQEVQRLSVELDTQSNRILEFKNGNANALPDGMEYRLNRQSLLQERLARLEREVDTMRSQRASIVKAFETTGRLQAAPQATLSPQEQQLASLRNELANALAIYSETNPRVLALKARIAQQETALLGQRSGASPSEQDDTQQSLYDITLTQLDTTIAAAQNEIDNATTELEELRVANARTSGNAISLEALERTHDNIQSQYNAAISRLNAARMEERVIASARGQRITVIEQASVPNAPASPNRMMIAAGGIGGGLALAFGLFLLLEVINRTVRRPSEITSRLGITPLATIPYMESNRDKFARRSLLVAAFLTVLVIIPTLLWAIDTYYQPLDLLVTRALARFGLS